MTPRLDNINEQRREKLDRLRRRDINPYPNRYEPTLTTQEAIALLEEAEAKEAPPADERPVRLAGRITAMRKMGKSSFLDFRDGSGKIQLLVQHGKLDEENSELFKDLDIGDII